MKIEVLMPKMGESITEGRILKWVKNAGDSIERDETILEIATDKVDTEVPAPANGILVQMLADEGDTVEVGKPVAYIETEVSEAIVIEGRSTDPVAGALVEEERDAQVELEVPQKDRATDIPFNASPATRKRFYSPVVMNIAASESISLVELERISGSGAGGRVTKQDLLSYIAERPSGIQTETVQDGTHPPRMPASPSLGIEIIPMDNMQRVMADHMVRSKQVSPHVALVSEVDMTKIVRFRDEHGEEFKSREGISLTFMPLIADATIRALKDFPLVNASLLGNDIHIKRFINLGIAVAMEGGGLIVPVIKHAEALNEVGLARAIADVARRARIKKLQPEEIQDGTFTITNFGVFGNTFGLPIINQPQLAILGVGALKKRPVVIEKDGDDVIAIRSILQLSLSFDHRIVDGALGGQFLEKIVRYLEEFSLTTI